MNTSPIIRHPGLNLWTLGHRRYYSPSVRTAGGWSALDPLVTPRVRPSLVLRSVSGPVDAAAGSGPVAGGRGRSPS
jgi:hypothetical protein